MNLKRLTVILASAIISHSCANYNPQVIPYQYSDWSKKKPPQIEMCYDIKAHQSAKLALKVEETWIDLIADIKDVKDAVNEFSATVDEITEPCLKERIQRYMKEPAFNQLLFEDPEIIEYISKSCVFDYWDKSLK